MVIADIKAYFQENSPLEIFEDIFKVLTGDALLSWFLDNVVTPFAEGILEAFGASTEDLEQTTELVKEILKSPFLHAYEKIKEIFTKIGPFFAERWTDIKAKLATVATWFSEKFTTAKNNVQTAFEPIVTWFGEKWEGIKEKFANVGTWFREKFTTAYTNIKQVFANIATWAAGIWNSIKTAFTNLGTSAGEAVGGALKTVVNGILKTVETTINNAISFINSAIDVINKIPNVSVSKIEKIEIPKLAQGGFVKANTPQLAMIGDNRTQGEFVAPEDKLQAAVVQAMMMAMPKMMQMMNQRSNMALAGGGDINVNCTAEIDGEVLFDILEKVKNRRNKRSGGNL